MGAQEAAGFGRTGQGGDVEGTAGGAGRSRPAARRRQAGRGGAHLDGARAVVRERPSRPSGDPQGTEKVRSLECRVSRRFGFSPQPKRRLTPHSKTVGAQTRGHRRFFSSGSSGRTDQELPNRTASAAAAATGSGAGSTNSNSSVAVSAGFAKPAVQSSSAKYASHAAGSKPSRATPIRAGADECRVSAASPRTALLRPETAKGVHAANVPLAGT